MSNQFHNRLVGTIVVVALGVIFLPDLLDGKNKQKDDGFTEIPLRPSFTESGSSHEMLGTVDIPTEPKIEQKTISKSNAEIVKKPRVKEKAKEQAESKKKSTVIDVAFTIQLGSFNNAKNVNALVNKLRKSGFTAYTIPRRPVDKRLTKVFVGPNISKPKLQKMLVEIDKLTKLKGKIISFNPVEQ